MVRSVNFASSQGRKHTKGLFRAGSVKIKEAPAVLSRPVQQQQQQHSLQQTQYQPTHTPSRSVPAGPISSQTSHPTGLSSLQAIQILLKELECLPKFPKRSIEPLTILRYVATLVSLKRQPVVLSLLLSLEFYLVEFVYKERRRRAWKAGISALKSKLRFLSKRILTESSIDSLYEVSCNVPVSRAVNYVHVLRDGRVRFMSADLLVPGDVVYRHEGGGKAKKESFINDKCPLRELLLSKLSPSHLPRPLYFSVSFSRFQTIFSVVFLVVSAMQSKMALSLSFWPLLLLSSQLPFALCWLVSGTYLSLLAQKLIDSPTPYADATEEDEFDEEAPPPVKNVHVSSWEVLSACFRSDDSTLLCQKGDLLQALGLLSVLCFTDREGAISKPFLKPVELILPSASEAEISAVQLAEESLNFHGSNLSAADLKAIALALLMTSECSQLLSIKELHCRTCTPTLYLPEQMQGCYCQIASQIGLNSSILDRFKRIKTIKKGSHCLTHLVLDSLDSSMHLFTIGELGEVLKTCSLANVSPNSQVRPLSESLSRKLTDFEWTMRSSDVFCAAFAYRPLLADESTSPAVSSNHSQFYKTRKLPATNFIFMALLATQPEPKANFQEFIDDLDAAGIRFALLSPARELASKAFAERLGLETDWNSCILLSENPHAASQLSGYSALSDIKARLPRGVSAIRPHLQHVDDIPLHVSIFAECEAQSSAEMIKIYQEAGEVVGIVSSFRAQQSIFAGDAFICYDLFGSENVSRSVTMDTIAETLKERFCVDLSLPAHTSPYILTELIRESRTLLHSARSAWEFFCGAAVCLFFIPDSASCAFFVLLASIAICFAAHDPAVLKTHSLTRTGSLPLRLRFMRFLPFAVVSIIFGRSDGMRLLIMMSTFAQSFSFLNPFRPFSRKHLYSWKIGVFHMACLMIILKQLPGAKLLLLSAFISGLLFVWQEWMKQKYFIPIHTTLQKRSKLLFSTKLGMHSPV